MDDTKIDQEWPRIYSEKQRSGQPVFRVDLGIVQGRRKRVPFPTLPKAQAYADQARIAKDNEGQAAFTLAMDIRLDAAKAHAILSPHGVSILDAARYYEKHVLAYKKAPPIKEIIASFISDAVNSNVKPRYLEDLKSRLGMFASDFGNEKLADLELDELKEWICDDEWQPRTRRSMRTRISQLFNYAIRHDWVEKNKVEKIGKIRVDETAIEIFTVEQAEQLLTHANEFELLPYIAIGLFAGVRRSELMGLTTNNVNFTDKVVTIPANVAKNRSRRHIDMQPALIAWLTTCQEYFKSDKPLVQVSKLRNNKQPLLDASEVKEWVVNGLRHSFGSYHYAQFQNAEKTSFQMGNTPEMVFKHYKALVKPTEAQKFWDLRPKKS